jgi:uncharacterized protein UPF0175
MKEHSIQYPDFVEQILQLPPEEIGAKILQMAALRMYEAGELSIERAAAVAGLTQDEFSHICACAAVAITVPSPHALVDKTQSTAALLRASDKPLWENGRKRDNGVVPLVEGLLNTASRAAIPAVLQHPAALEVIELLQCQAWQALLEEPTTLQILAHLVVEGLVSVEECRLVITPVGTYHIQNLISTKYARFLE